MHVCMCVLVQKTKMKNRWMREQRRENLPLLHKASIRLSPAPFRQTQTPTVTAGVLLRAADTWPGGTTEGHEDRRTRYSGHGGSPQVSSSQRLPCRVVGPMTPASPSQVNTWTDGFLLKMYCLFVFLIAGDGARGGCQEGKEQNVFVGHLKPGGSSPEALPHFADE